MDNLQASDRLQCSLNRHGDETVMRIADTTVTFNNLTGNDVKAMQGCYEYIMSLLDKLNRTEVVCPTEGSGLAGLDSSHCVRVHHLSGWVFTYTDDRGSPIYINAKDGVGPSLAVVLTTGTLSSITTVGELIRLSVNHLLDSTHAPSGALH